MNLPPITKGALAIILSKLQGFHEPKVILEQYTTDSQIAADVLWTAFQLGDIQNKIVADLGAGTGILGIGALLLGAKQVYFVESEKNVLTIAQQNTKTTSQLNKVNGTPTFVHSKVEQFSTPVDCIIQNPPFGTRTKGADTLFLQSAFKNAPIIYSFHKTVTRKHIEKVSEQADFAITHAFPFQFPLKATLATHTKHIQRIDVTAFRIEEKTQSI